MKHSVIGLWVQSVVLFCSGEGGRLRQTLGEDGLNSAMFAVSVTKLPQYSVRLKSCHG